VFNATDNVSGIANTTYVLGNGTSQNGSNITISQQGNTSLTFFSTDLAGNVDANQTINILIDSIKPNITVQLNDSTPQSSDTIEFLATILDNTSLNVNISVNGQQLNFTQNASNYTANYTLTSKGVYNYSVYAVDVANNSYQVDGQFTVYTKSTSTNITINDTFVDATSQTSSSLRLKTNTTLQGNVTILSSKVKPSSITTALPRAVKHTTVQLSQNIKDALEWANLTISYNDSEISELNESSMQMAWYNESADQWINLSENLSFVNQIGVDATNNILWANVTHFSTYAITGNEPESETEPETPQETEESSSSGGGGGGGGGGGLRSLNKESNTNITEVTLRSIKAGEPVTQDLNIEGLSLTQIQVVSQQDSFLATFTIQKKQIPTDAPTGAYEYFTLSLTGADLDEAVLQFTADNTTRLFQESRSWPEIVLTQVSRNTYQATITSLGSFVLVKEQENKVQQQSTDTAPEESQEQTPVGSVVRDQSPLSESVHRDSASVIFLILGILSVLIIIGVKVEDSWHRKSN
jgi:hypothetical protein